MFSVVLPCFNESRHGYLPQILENLRSQSGPKQLIAVVSPSQDDTLAIIQRFPEIEIIQTTASNRAQRLNVGIEASKGEYVLLHHPATLLPEDNAFWQAESALKQHCAVWGGFIHSFDMDHWLLRFTSWYSTSMRSRQGILYLDHCIFATREALTAVGGVPDIDIFEDTALSIALRDFGKASKHNGRAAIASGKVTTSARRFRDRGIYRQALVNQMLKLMYYAKLDPQRLNWLYERKSQINVSYTEQEK
ncbi:glycosyl transferase, group 2 family protein [Synechococcus sp. PCC 7335]|uniref:glycosyltransferase n=1 Tax=Synechococcus sp. (strain ATCC 29403 / PCC 7335) TaxID=91464 RepID=UPI00017EB512|nr:glycosyltransferase [Synechococcus sp. PCC 7335]EDX87163.1 glycosyl transferase, group 2 family protein [Synechococcus sp. PCC 7335]